MSLPNMMTDDMVELLLCSGKRTLIPRDWSKVYHIVEKTKLL